MVLFSFLRSSFGPLASFSLILRIAASGLMGGWSSWRFGVRDTGLILMDLGFPRLGLDSPPGSFWRPVGCYLGWGGQALIHELNAYLCFSFSFLPVSL